MLLLPSQSMCHSVLGGWRNPTVPPTRRNKKPRPRNSSTLEHVENSLLLGLVKLLFIQVSHETTFDSFVIKRLVA